MLNVAKSWSRRILHCRMFDNQAGVECHQQALSRALGVPDDAGLAVAARSRGRQRMRHGMAHGMKLMIAGKDFGDLASGIAEDYEILQEVQKAATVEHALEHRLQFWCGLGGQTIAGHCPPRHEPLSIRRQRANTRGDTIGDDQSRIGTKKRSDLYLVGLQLVESTIQRSVLVAGILEFDHAERQAIDALDRITVQATVLRDQQRCLGLDQLRQYLGLSLRSKCRIEPGDGRSYAPDQQHVTVARALRSTAIWPNIGATHGVVAKLAQPCQRCFLDMAFGKRAHCAASAIFSASFTRISPEINFGKRRSRVLASVRE